MRIRGSRSWYALLCLIALWPTSLPSQTSSSSSSSSHGTSSSSQPPAMSDAQKAAMEKWLAFANPGEAHKVLASKAGTWTANVKMWQAAGMPAQESTGVAKLEMIMDGRYLSDQTDGASGGQSFHGRGLTGYDNLKKRYVGTWIDNQGTGIMISEGTYDSKTRTFHYKSQIPDVLGGKYVPMRSVEKIVSDDKWVMEMYSKGSDGKEFKNMEIDYTRKKEK